MSVAFIPFNAFSPGGSSFGDQLQDVKNVLPLYGSYFPLRQKLVGTSIPFGAVVPVTGGYVHVNPTGIGTATYQADAATIFGGTKRALWDTATNPWTDLSKIGGYGIATFPAAWRFVSVGNDVWATNGVDPVQRRTANAGLFADGITSTFKPAGRFPGVVREYMILASLSNAGRASDEFAWSDANDATWFDDRTGARPQSLAGSKAIRSRKGQITGFVGGEFGVFFKRKSIHALQFTGGNDVWRLDEVSHGIGCALPSSLIAGEEGNCFFSGRGFYSQSGLDAPQKISPPEIDQLFTDPSHFLDKGFVHDTMTTMSGEDSLMLGVEDAATGVKMWFYRTAGAATEGAGIIAGIAYDPASQLWSRIDGIDLFNELNLTTVIARPDNYTEQTITGTARLDTIRVIGFDSDTTTARTFTFSGDHEQAQFVTQRQAIAFEDISPTGRFKLIGALPIVTVPDFDPLGDQPPVPNISITIRTANEPQYIAEVDGLGGAVSPRSETYTQADANEWGWFPHNLEGRLWDITVTIPAGSEWRNFTGIWIAGEPVG